MSGIDGFIGDGRISDKPEEPFAAYYNINVNRFTWLTLDIQRVTNPTYNSDRGAARIAGFRLHLEY